MPCASRSSCIHSNSRSISAVLGIKPRVLYNDVIFNKKLTRFGCDLLGTYSMVVNLIFLDIVVTKGNPLTNVTSAAIVTYLSMLRISFRIATQSAINGPVVLLTVYPLRVAMSSPNNL
jgi:hypothetical protein